MGKCLLGVMVATTALTISACGRPATPHERKLAPTGKSDVGLLIDTNNDNDIDQILAAHPSAQVRRLNPRHGFYELFGVDREEILRLAPNATVDRNKYFEFKPMAMPVQAGLKMSGLKECKTAAQFPTAVATVAQGSTIELGQTLKVSSLKSKPHLLAPGELKAAYLVIPPEASKAGRRVILGKEFEFTPDALGVYRIFLVVQDSRDVCSMDAVQIITTANRPFAPSAVEGRIDLNKISHLQTVSAEESWKISQGQGILIAIIDTGVNYNHPLLAANIELNKKELPNGRDSDGNGFIDDQLGFDFVNSDAFPYDDDGHGTHVAGLAAALQFGMAQKAKILPIKALTSVGGDAGSIAAAIHYAVDRGARIINLSIGTIATEPHPAIVRAVAYAESKGALLVAASGNGDPGSGLGFDLDSIPVFPAALTHDNVISVGAQCAGEILATYSNFGAKGVDVIAPGGMMPSDPILSTAFENPADAKFIAMSGTSMATPIVAGIAAQVWALDPHMTNKAVKKILLESGDEIPGLKTITVSGRHLNARAAVERAQIAGALF